MSKNTYGHCWDYKKPLINVGVYVRGGQTDAESLPDTSSCLKPK